MSKGGVGAASMRSHLPGDVVADEAEPRDAAVLLHDTTQSTLRVLRHAVCFVEDDDLVRRAGEVAARETASEDVSERQ